MHSAVVQVEGTAPWHTFSKVSALVNLPYNMAMEGTFQNVCPSRRRMMQFELRLETVLAFSEAFRSRYSRYSCP